jgi:fused signal recognition particle receptor
LVSPFFEKVVRGLTRTREAMHDGLKAVLETGGPIDDAGLDDIEDLLIQADVGLETATAVVDELRRRLRDQARDLGADDVIEVLQAQISAGMAATEPLPITTPLPHRPFVILVVGVNGTGKTTTVGKLAKQYADAGKNVMLAACDTFRAAAIPQLAVWARRADAALVQPQVGADPAAVAFDALSSAKARQMDVLIVDTAGRLHTKVNLMEELKKIGRSLAKQEPGAPHETLMVVDATTGQNALSQAREFHAAMQLSGLVLTKLDGTAKGGIALALKRELEIPVKLVGLGEGADDLQAFDAAEFAQALFDSSSS